MVGIIRSFIIEVRKKERSKEDIVMLDAILKNTGEEVKFVNWENVDIQEGETHKKVTKGIVYHTDGIMTYEMPENIKIIDNKLKTSDEIKKDREMFVKKFKDDIIKDIEKSMPKDVSMNALDYQNGMYAGMHMCIQAILLRYDKEYGL